MISRLTYKFKLYRNEKNKVLDKSIELAAEVWNHCIALHRRYYKLTGKYINVNAMMKHVATLKKLALYRHWQALDAQAIQDVCQRIDRSYQLFFKSRAGKIAIKVGRPGFRKRSKYDSFTLKQTGWKLIGSNTVKILGRHYRFFKSRNIDGVIKTVTVKRSAAGEHYICFSVEKDIQVEPVMTGKSAGFDFGLKTFLTLSDGTKIESPLFFKHSQKEIVKLNRALSRKAKKSNHRKQARIALAKAHERIANQRRDWFFKLAHQLTDRFDRLFFETLNLKAMQRLWGRKVSDLAFAEFVSILEHVAKIKGRFVGFINRFYPSSKTCSCCGYVNHELTLSHRFWRCPSCQIVHDRDENASVNIYQEGMSSCGVGDIRPPCAAIAV